jgi:hypothetical protein
VVVVADTKAAATTAAVSFASLKADRLVRAIVIVLTLPVRVSAALL